MFKGKQISLKKVSMDDVDNLYRLWSNQNIMQYMAFDAISSKIEAHTMMRNMLNGIDSQEELRMKIVDHDDVFLGCVGAPRLDFVRNMCEISFEVLEEYQKQDYGYESVELFIDYLFKSYQFDYIEAIVFPFNEASAKLLTKLNFRYEGRVHKYLKKNDQWYDVDVYHLYRFNH